MGAPVAEGMDGSIFRYFQDMGQQGAERSMKPAAAIPSFALFGEEDPGQLAGFGHIETIAARSSLHDWEITPHRHASAVQMLILQQGQVEAVIDGARIIQAGPCFLSVPAQVVHGFRFTPETVGHVLTLSQEFAGRRGPQDAMARLLGRAMQGGIAPPVLARVAWLCDEMLTLTRDWRAPPPLFGILAEALVHSLGESARGAGPDTPDTRRLAQLHALVETHLTQHRDLDFYASALGITVRTLTRLTRQHLGAPPQVLINRRLALEAQRLLRFTNAGVAQVAEELGFADPSYFSRFYLRMTGRRPQAEKRG
jgi:AraC family transcriptional regulator, transcriptional activator of pobA